MPQRVRIAPRKQAKQDRSRHTVEALLQATARVLSREGYDKASTNRIAEVAGVNIGSLYQYFPNKDALVAALIDRHIDELRSVMNQSMTTLLMNPAPVAARAVVEAYLKLHQMDPALQRSRVAIGALAHDECARPKTTAASLAALPPAFGGLHTLGHAPPICDGAALALLTATGPARAQIRGYAEVGGDPVASLTAGFTAMELALKRAGVRWEELDRVEHMEAFAVVQVKFLREQRIDPARVNVAGGHLAKGHPMGATGAILLSQLLDALDDADGELGLVVATGTTGVGAAIVVERLR